MNSEPCRDWFLTEYVKGNSSVKISEGHNWDNGWRTIKEESCFTKDGYNVTLQERECKYCGLIQQRRVRL